MVINKPARRRPVRTGRNPFGNPDRSAKTIARWSLERARRRNRHAADRGTRRLIKFQLAMSARTL